MNEPKTCNGAANDGRYHESIEGQGGTAEEVIPRVDRHLRLGKEQFVATGAWFFLVVNLSKVPIYSWYHLFSRSSLAFDALMIPAVICGAVTGLWLVHRVPQRVFELLIIVLTAVSTVLLFR